MNTFQFLGVAMVIYIAGLKGIPPEYYEVAQIDGANWHQRLRYVTIPLLMPSINAAVVMNVIGGLKLFDVIMALTKGGPGYDTMSLSNLPLAIFLYTGAMNNISASWTKPPSSTDATGSRCSSRSFSRC